MSRAERRRANLRGSARHSNLMADGRGDPRDHRREGSRLTDNAFDPTFFEIDTDGRLTLTAGAATGAAGTEPGRGLRIGTDGKLEVFLGGGLTFDAGRGVSIAFSELAELTDNSAGTASDTLAAIPDPVDAPATADDLREDLVANVLPPLRDALASLAAKLNAILDTATNTVRT